MKASRDALDSLAFWLSNSISVLPSLAAEVMH
jgi:hypothetical protein